jgi:hypothetical protein
VAPETTPSKALEDVLFRFGQSRVVEKPVVYTSLREMFHKATGMGRKRIMEQEGDVDENRYEGDLLGHLLASVVLLGEAGGWDMGSADAAAYFQHLPRRRAGELLESLALTDTHITTILDCLEIDARENFGVHYGRLGNEYLCM